MQNLRVPITILRWFDSYAERDDKTLSPGRKVDWPRIVPFIALHLVCLGVLVVGWSWAALSVAVALYCVRMVAITGFYHRYFSHRTFKTSRVAQFIFAFVAGFAIQRGPLWWASHHRLHHRRSDSESDVHSPRHHGFLWSHIGWITSEENFPTRLDVVRDLACYPELVFLDRFNIVVPVTLGVALYGFGELLAAHNAALNTSGIQMVVWGLAISSLVAMHATFTINSLAHRFGTRRYETGDDSRNSFLLALITFGEGWHNNHHHYPAAIRQGFYWWEIDITYLFLRTLAWAGIIWDLKPVPDSVLNARRIGAPAARGALASADARKLLAAGVSASRGQA